MSSFSNMLDEEAMVITCTSLVFLCSGRTSPEYKKQKHAVWVQDHLTKTVFDKLQRVF